MLNHTEEFSIILRLDESAAADIQQVRKLLPSSPFRDDPAHVTLLKDIHATHNLSDAELMVRIEPAINRLLNSEPLAHVSHLANLPGGPYRDTSAVMMVSSAKLQRQHISLISHFRGHGFNVGGNSAFTSPHASIRLGVPFTEDALALAEKLFPRGRGIGFDGWEILRLAADTKKRPFYEINPNAATLSTKL